MSDRSISDLLVGEVSDYAIYMLDPAGRVVSWNRGAARIKGYTAEEISGRHFSCFYTPDDQVAGLPDAALKIATETGHYAAEGWRCRKDGSRFWASVVITPIYDQAKLIGFAKVTRDLTAQQVLIAAAREAERHFRLLVESVTEYAIFMLDPDGRVVSWNVGAERIKGYTAEEIIGKHFSCFYASEDVASGHPAQALETARREGRYEADAWRCRKDGSLFWANVVIAPIFQDEELVGFAKVTRDLTERRNKAAADAALREQLIAVLGHDLRNPLFAIISGAELLLDKLRDDPATSIVGIMLNSGLRMSALIESVLDFARGQLGGGLPVCRAADRLIEPLLQQVIDETRTSAPDRTIEAAFNLASPISCDPARIGQLFSNLLGNAITHGSVTAPVHVRAASEAGTFELSVVNSGEQISPAVIDRLFEPFVRGSVRWSREGLGLGLYIAREIAKAHGGTLNVTSTLEETCFTFRMPAG
jgi:PAS domain S-box-containing protein